ncbi:uncharacterized protein LOC143413622 isoform X1 [Maylandia zebra]|uniref:uncharacterized protein LOC143413622 isoform X1 n=1 Tax=Maylandia zebra TaxID=106582 RepID=UPI00403C2C3E
MNGLHILRRGGESRERECSSLVKGTGEEEVSIQETSKRTVSKQTLWHNKSLKSSPDVVVRPCSPLDGDNLAQASSCFTAIYPPPECSTDLPADITAHPCVM